MEDSNISWTHNTWNPWVGCDKVAPECAKCYIGREIRKQADCECCGDVAERLHRMFDTMAAEDEYGQQEEL
jgi:protein gp37